MNIRLSTKLTITAALLFVSGAGFAQGGSTMMDQPTSNTTGTNDAVKSSWEPSLVRDGAYDRAPHVMAVQAWQPLREADVFWKKRVWREIDIREKQNIAFRYPGDDQTGGGLFIEVILDAIKKGKIKAYSTVDDRFTAALTKEQIMEMLAGKADTTPVEDPITGKISMTITHRDFNTDLITKYRVKEDWMFDRNLGRMVVRIIGLAPIIDRYGDDNQFRASSPLLWIYYPEARPVFAQYEVYNPENDVQRLNWDDYLEGRYWHGRIIQVSNAFNESFRNSGMSNMDALYEAQRATEEIFDKEHDMWVY